MQNQEKIIQAIAAYLEENTFLNDSDIYAPEITFGIVKEYPTPTHTECCQEIATEITAAIAPHPEAGAGWNWNTSNVLPEITNGKYSELLIMKTKEGGYELGHFKDTSKEKYCGLPVAFAINNGSYDEDEMFYEIESVEKWSYIH